MATFNGIGIAAVSADRKHILYAVKGLNDHNAIWQAFNIVESKSGLTLDTVYVPSTRRSNMSAVVKDIENANPSHRVKPELANIRWNWLPNGINTPPSTCVDKYDSKCPVCKDTVTFENRWAEKRILMTHVSNRGCIIETGNSKLEDTVKEVIDRVTDTKTIPITGMCSQCGNNLGACTCETAPPVPPVQSQGELDKLNIIWTQALPAICETQQKQGNALLTLTKRVDDHDTQLEFTTNTLDGVIELESALNQRVKALEASQPKVTVINLNDASNTSVKIDGLIHKQFEVLLKRIRRGDNVALVGPAGSGKSFVAAQVAHALGLTFDMQAFCLQSSKSDAIGMLDAHGIYHDTPFRRQYENGGLWLGDEFDAAFSAVQVVINGGIANGHCAFADKLVTKSLDFRALVAMNTFGRGANRIYNGRQQLDGATLNRFIGVLEWEYDRDIERALISKYVTGDVEKWLNFVWSVRDAIEKHALPMIASTRNIERGACALADGEDWDTVEDDYLFCGAPIEMVQKIRHEVGERF